MLSEEKGVLFARSLIKKIKEKNLIFSFDVNFRYDLFKTKEDANKAYKYFIEKADILKFSSDEILDYTGEESLDAAIKKLNHKGLLLITMGSLGSMFEFNNNRDNVESNSVKPIDTTGAGDAFYGAVLAKIDEIGYSKLNKEVISNILKFGNNKGAQATLHKGAVQI
jgi:fructokinase